MREKGKVFKKLLGGAAVVFMMTLLLGMTSMAAPANLSGLKQSDATTSSATISWNKASGATFYAIYNYDIRNGEPTTLISTTSSTTYKFTGLDKDQLYSIAVVPFDATNEYGYWEYLIIKPAPEKVSSIVANYSTSKKVSLSWKEKNAVDGYEVWVNNKKKATPEYSFTNISLGSSKFYKIKVRPYILLNGGKTKKYGAWAEIYTSNQKMLKAKRVSQGIRFSWGKVSGASSYTIYGKQGGSIFSYKSEYKKLTTVKKNSCTITKIKKSKLKSGNVYSFYVVANKKVGKKTYKSVVGKAQSWTYY